MGFSRQGSWSGLPFLSPRDLPNPGIKPGSPALQADALPSEPPGKPKVKMKVAQLCSTLCDPTDCIVHGILQARILEWVAFPFSRGSSQPGGRTQVSYIAGGFFTSWATRKVQYFFKPPFLVWGGAKNTGVGCHSLLQEIFPTQGLNPGIPHCRQTLYRLSHQGSAM